MHWKAASAFTEVWLEHLGTLNKRPTQFELCAILMATSESYFRSAQLCFRNANLSVVSGMSSAGILTTYTTLLDTAGQQWLRCKKKHLVSHVVV